MSAVVPVLKPAHWVGRHTHFAVPLLAEDPGGPLLCFAEEGAHLRFLDTEALGTHAEDAEGYARACLTTQPTTWQDRAFAEGRLPVLSCEADPLAAERLLDDVFLRAAADHLQATALLVAIPCRGLLLACDARHHGTDLGEDFQRVVDRCFFAGDAAPITRRLFRVAEGRIRATHGEDPEEVPVEGIGLSLDKIAMADGTFGIEVEVHLAPHLADPQGSLVEALNRLVDALCHHSDFGGTIGVTLLLADGADPALGDLLAGGVHRYGERLATRTPGGRPIVVSLEDVRGASAPEAHLDVTSAHLAHEEGGHDYWYEMPFSERSGPMFEAIQASILDGVQQAQEDPDFRGMISVRIVVPEGLPPESLVPIFRPLREEYEREVLPDAPPARSGVPYRMEIAFDTEFRIERNA